MTIERRYKELRGSTGRAPNMGTSNLRPLVLSLCNVIQRVSENDPYGD